MFLVRLVKSLTNLLAIILIGKSYAFFLELFQFLDNLMLLNGESILFNAQLFSMFLHDLACHIFEQNESLPFSGCYRTVKIVSMEDINNKALLIFQDFIYMDVDLSIHDRVLCLELFKLFFC